MFRGNKNAKQLFGLIYQEGHSRSRKKFGLGDQLQPEQRFVRFLDNNGKA